MTHFLRDKNGCTVVDIDKRGADDFSVSVDIFYYSFMLLEVPEDRQRAFIDDFNHIQELRGYWHEVADHTAFKDWNDFVEWNLKDIGNRWGLGYVTD